MLQPQADLGWLLSTALPLPLFLQSETMGSWVSLWLSRCSPSSKQALLCSDSVVPRFFPVKGPLPWCHRWLQDALIDRRSAIFINCSSSVWFCWVFFFWHKTFIVRIVWKVGMVGKAAEFNEEFSALRVSLQLLYWRMLISEKFILGQCLGMWSSAYDPHPHWPRVLHVPNSANFLGEHRNAMIFLTPGYGQS